ncbi:unnamed protein product [Adineta ricciae]|uniref:Uncharacterized protein n=1 Tax=Adineta ricciae TaxID=249248 RepID=A0A815NNL9_ADIRI|nr:unnamed protein product [Adineta ricciae]CAF1440712.1 unnamed protein product [Adineta ricciae]
MGTFFSTSSHYSTHINGGRVNIWINSEALFHNITSMIDEKIMTGIQKFRHTLTVNNTLIMLNILMILTILILCILKQWQPVSGETDVIDDPCSCSTDCSTSDGSGRKNNVKEYLV